MSGAIQIAAIEAKEAAKDGTSLEDKLTKAMKAVNNHWMVTNPDEQYIAALSAVLSIVDGEDKDRLEAEIQHIKTLNAALGGVPVDISAIEPLSKPVGIIKLWKQVRSNQ